MNGFFEYVMGGRCSDGTAMFLSFFIEMDLSVLPRLAFFLPAEFFSHLFFHFYCFFFFVRRFFFFFRSGIY